MATTTSSSPPLDVTNKSVVAILRAAKTLFLEHGYDGVSLEGVAELARVARQTVYNRFGSKEAVFRSMVQWHWSFFDLDDMLAAPELEPTGEPDPVLRHIAGAILDFLAATDQIAFTRLVIGESRRWPWIGEEFYRLGKGPALGAFAGQLRRMHEAGSIDCPNPQIAAHQFLGLIQEFVIWPHVMAVAPADLEDVSTTTVVDEAVRMFLARYGGGGPARAMGS